MLYTYTKTISYENGIIPGGIDISNWLDTGFLYIQRRTINSFITGNSNYRIDIRCYQESLDKKKRAT